MGYPSGQGRIPGSRPANPGRQYGHQVDETAAAGHLNAIRTAYDTVAADYADQLRDELAGRPVDRAALGAFADLVRAADADGRVVEAGCGPGRITAHLAGLGLRIFGVDMSPGMLAVARRSHPDLEYTRGYLAALPVADGALTGLVAWYSIIHTPPEQLGPVFAEFRRVLRPGGELLLAFQAGDERLRLHQAYGHPISLDAYRLPPGWIEDQLNAAGLVTHTRIRREPGPRESTPQAFLLARAEPAAPAGADQGS
jgi:SAM-dependent methyltransferase